MIKEIDKENYFEIAFSDIAHQEDRDCTGVIYDTIKKLKSYCTFVGIKSRLHLNRKGSSLLAGNIA